MLIVIAGVKITNITEILEPVFRTRNGFEDECAWQPVDGSVMCPLNQVTMKEVYLRTVMADASFKMVVEEFRMLYNRSPVIKSTDRTRPEPGRRMDLKR